MFSPFSFLISPLSGICIVLAAIALFSCRSKSWYFILWLPITLWSLAGTIIFLSGIALLFTISGESGEAAGFAGFGAVMVMGRTIFFVVGLILCCIAHPRKESFRAYFVIIAVSLSIVLLAGIAWQTHHFQSGNGMSLWKSPLVYFGKVVDESNQPIADVQISYIAKTMNESREEVHIVGTAKSDGRGIFKIDGVNGISLILQLSHPNYYPYPENPTGFDKRNIPKKGYFSDSEEKADLFRMHSKYHALP
jgi:hypothetical protein